MAPISIPETNTTTAVEWVVGPEGCNFYTKRWIPEGEPECYLVFVHGFVEHIQRYDHVFPIYAKKGISVLAFDGRGFGETANATKPSSQGRTSWAQQIQDIDFFLNKEWETNAKPKGKKLFLMGHSMGGGLAIAFATREKPSPMLKHLSGIISSAPLIRQTPAAASPLLLLRVGRLIGSVAPKLQMKVGKEPDPKKVKDGQLEESWRSDICRDKDVVKAYETDPLCTPFGTYKGTSDMILGGVGILSGEYKRFPPKLPVLFIHGTGDKVTFCEATEELSKKIPSEEVTFKPFEGLWHELHNEPGDDKWMAINYTSDWVVSHKSAPSLLEKTTEPHL